MAVGDEGVAATSCPTGAPRLPQLLCTLTGAASAPAELNSGARREQQRCGAPVSAAHTSGAMSCPARRAAGWGRQAWLGWRRFPHVQEDIKAAAGARGMLQIPGHVLLSRARLF